MRLNLFPVPSVIFSSSSWQEWVRAVAGRGLALTRTGRGSPLLLSTALHSIRPKLTPAGLVLSLLLAGCAHTVNLLNPNSPQFEGSYASVAPRPEPTRLRVVSFNIKLADDIDGAIEVLRTGELANADVLSLQEMDESGTERIARALHLNYV